MVETTFMLQILNQIFDAQKKSEQENANKTKRNLDRIVRLVEQEFNWSVINPMGEKYDITRTDCDATISEGSSANQILDVLKPMIRDNTNQSIIQKAVVLV